MSIIKKPCLILLNYTLFCNNNFIRKRCSSWSFLLKI